jgi:peptide/nickel transport system permease protein
VPPLLKIILRRLALGVLTLLLVSVLVFAATQALPGDTARAILGKSATPERLAALREQLGLNRPALAQYISWLGASRAAAWATRWWPRNRSPNCSAIAS